MNPVVEPSDATWAELREAQTQTLSIENTGMATIIDVGDSANIHPIDKQTVGYRLSLAARKVAYGEDLVYSGPAYREMRIDGNRIYITFDQVGAGLKAKDKYGYLKGFTVAGEDHKFKWAMGIITGKNTVMLICQEIENPVAVRYAWADNPDDVNLYNVEGLPAIPFRTDDWKGITK
jgi:sialate O-acetylesterase